MPIPEIFIAGIVKKLFDKLASIDLVTFARREGVLKEINKWSTILRKIAFVLSDAENKQESNSAVKLWLEELEDLAYDLDDTIDTFDTEQVKLQVESSLHNSIKSKVKGILPGCCSTSSSFSPCGITFNSAMMRKIKTISTRMDWITKQIIDLKLNNTTRFSTDKPTTSTFTTASLSREIKVCGRDKEIEELLEFVCKDAPCSGDSDRVRVIPIVGMGGIGKTTIAQALYNDKIVNKKFHLKAWVFVSHEFDILRITKIILEHVTMKKCDFDDLDQVQVELTKCLAKKKFLLVLDDVWHRDYHEWNVLKSSFCDAARGSKVIITTRDENVALLLGSSKLEHHTLQSLTFNDCWSVFSQHAFRNRNIIENASLVEIGKKIVGKCKGLPLSAMVLGGLLQCKETEAEWKVILDSEWWEDNQILPSLWLSYRHLPSHLKPCFAYCSIFPKDYVFGKDELVLLWMAQGLIHEGRDNRQLEDIGRDYFHELVSRSLFQLSSYDGSTELFMMHDMVNDLATVISGDFCFRLEDNPSDQGRFRNLGKARHSSYWQREYDGMKKFERLSEAKFLRTFLPFSLNKKRCYLANNVSSTLFPKLMYMRSLSLRYYIVTVISDSVGDMKHLRYLDLSHTDIETLPDWVLTLYNLQTLFLRECKRLKNLPKNMGNLINLRHFDVTGANRIKEMPLGIGSMKSLQMLSNFIVSKDSGSRIRELGNLGHIRKTLCISGLDHVIDPMDANGAGLIEKEHLSKLIMIFGANSDEMTNDGVRGEVLRMMQPHNNLEELHIMAYRGTSFPTWLKDPLFTNMVHIQIKDCANCSVLPSFGQLKSLKRLYIEGMSSVKHVSREFYGPLSQKPFLSLETLSFYNMPQWDDWFDFGVEDEIQPFGHLKNLIMKNCPNLLGKLPTNLPCLEVFEITKCEKLVLKLDGIVYPSLTSLYMNGVEIPSTPPIINYVKNTHESSSISFFEKLTSLSSAVTKKNSTPSSFFNMNGSFQNLNSVEITGGPKLVYLPVWLSCLLPSLKTLIISSCEELETLLPNINSDVVQLHHQFPDLEQVEIKSCRELVSFFSKEMDEKSGSKPESIAVQSFMERLKGLRIVKCDKLEKLPRGLYMLPCLVELVIMGCPKLVSFPERGFPPTLVELTLRNCKALESPLPCWNSDHNLETLIVNFCPSLTRLFSSFGSNNIRTSGLPSSLKRLHIRCCEKLEALFSGETEIRIHCPSLDFFGIELCSKFKYLSDTRSDDSLWKLRIFSLSGCLDLQYLPDGWVRALTNLNCIRIGRETIVSSYILKETGFFTNLENLQLFKTKGSVHPSEWGLHRMTSLRILHIEGPITVVGEEEREGEKVKMSVFPLDGMLLPTSLFMLTVKDFPDLKRLSKGFERLSSLQLLAIYDCPSLEYFPKGGFPDNLLALDIWGSPIIKKKCEKVNGEYGSIVSRFPYVSWGNTCKLHPKNIKTLNFAV